MGKIIVWVCFTGLPACLAYLTNFWGAATRVEGTISNIAPLLVALAPFLAIWIATACLALGAWKLFFLLPPSLGLRFSLYSRRRVRDDLYPILQEAIELDRASETAPEDFGKILDFQAQIELVKVGLDKLNIPVNIDLQYWPLLVRRLEPFAKSGYLDEVRRICGEFIDLVDSSPAQEPGDTYKDSSACWGSRRMDGRDN